MFSIITAIKYLYIVNILHVEKMVLPINIPIGGVIKKAKPLTSDASKLIKSL